MENIAARKTLGALLLGLTLLLLLLAGLAEAGPGATTRYVAPGGDCGGATPCYTTIQAAVDAANEGDEIRVAAGTYTHSNSYYSCVVYISKTITLRGGYATDDWQTSHPEVNITLLDGQTGNGIVITATSATLDGFHVTGAVDGILATSSTVTLTRIVASSSDTGFSLVDSDATLVNVVAIGNTNDGIAFSGHATAAVTYATVTYNDVGVHIHGASQATIYNVIVATQTTGILKTTGLTVTVDGVLWHGNRQDYFSIGGNSNFFISHEYTGDPDFAADGYHIGPASAAVDRAIDVGIDNDLDGEPRPTNKGFDLGADEYVYWRVALSPGQSGHVVLPGRAYTYWYKLGNHSNVDDSYSLTLSPGWGGLLTTSPITVLADTVSDVGVQVTVPTTTLSGTVQTGVLTATSRGHPATCAVAQQITTVGLSGTVILAPHREGIALPGRALVYTHTLENEVNYTQTFTLTAAPAAGLSLTLPSTLTVPPFARATVGLTVEVQPGANTGPVTTVLTATGNLCGAAAVTDTVFIPRHTFLPLVMSNYSALVEVEEAPDSCPGLGIQVDQSYSEDFDHANDNDWYEFTGQAGVTYTVRTFDLGPLADTVLAVYGPGCGGLLAENDDCVADDPASGSCLAFQAPAAGQYHVQVRHYDWSVYGPGTGYTLRVAR